MNTRLLPWMTSVVGIAGAVIFSSCTYNPGYYGPASGYSSYSTTGYVGYPSSRFSTSVFISTGNPRWGYDPYCRSYYDYTRRCYYDPWLRGYYPRGYRPPILVGVPHPHGWHSGRDVCPPPRNHRDYTLVNYKSRGESYQKLGQSWSRNVRLAPSAHHKSGARTSNRGNHYRGDVIKRPGRDYRYGSPGTRSDDNSKDPSYLKRKRMEQIRDSRSSVYTGRTPTYRQSSTSRQTKREAIRPPSYTGRRSSTYRQSATPRQLNRETVRSQSQHRSGRSYSKPEKRMPPTRSAAPPRSSSNSSQSNQGNSDPRKLKKGR